MDLRVLGALLNRSSPFVGHPMVLRRGGEAHRKVAGVHREQRAWSYSPLSCASYAAMVARNIIVVGTSAGGFEALQRLVSGFPADLPATVFITMHLFERSKGVLSELLSRVGPLPAMQPWEGAPIRPGQIYVAPPNYHMILGRTSVHLGHGPKENLQRPCINTMFRSAAANHGERVAGVLLTGMLDDGAAGLWEIQQHGGATVVQDPDEAAFRSMPDSAIRGLNVQYIQRLAEISPLLTRLSMGDNDSSFESSSASAPHEESTAQACPECGGVMRLYRLGKLHEYRCHVGHRLGLETMIAEKSEVVERSIWTALSQCEELCALLEETLSEEGRSNRTALQQELADRHKEQEVLRAITKSVKVQPLT